jgi:hypothetical protein
MRTRVACLVSFTLILIVVAKLSLPSAWYLTGWLLRLH